MTVDALKFLTEEENQDKVDVISVNDKIGGKVELTLQFHSYAILEKNMKKMNQKYVDYF